jgi:annexin A7/11
MDGPGTKEKVLNDILLGRSNTDLRAIKDLYHKTYHRSLESAVKADLSMKTERHFLMVLEANRAEESAPVIPQQIDQDVMEIYKATEGKVGTDELLVCSILSKRSNAQIGAIAHTYKQKFTKDLESVIKRVCDPFSTILVNMTNAQAGVLWTHGGCPPAPTTHRYR